jgi:hypothetical protein
MRQVFIKISNRFQGCDFKSKTNMEPWYQTEFYYKMSHASWLGVG